MLDDDNLRKYIFNIYSNKIHTTNIICFDCIREMIDTKNELEHTGLFDCVRGNTIYDYCNNLYIFMTKPDIDKFFGRVNLSIYSNYLFDYDLLLYIVMSINKTSTVRFPKNAHSYIMKVENGNISMLIPNEITNEMMIYKGKR